MVNVTDVTPSPFVSVTSFVSSAKAEIVIPKTNAITIKIENNLFIALFLYNISGIAALDRLALSIEFIDILKHSSYNRDVEFLYIRSIFRK